MRETFSSLIQTSQDYVNDSASTSQTSLSDSLTFIKKEINKTVRSIQSELSDFLTQRTQTASAVVDQQYYYLPPDTGIIESITVTVAGRDWPLKPMEVDEWLSINANSFSGTAIPRYYFRREKDFGIWPIPQDTNTITLTYNRITKDMTNVDYSTGTVTTTQNSATITGSGTTWTAGMVGRYFKSDTDGDYYRILSYTSATSLTLESVMEGSSQSGDTYIIAESPEIPPQLHELIPYKVAAAYYAGPRRDQATAQTMLNYFYTGDFNNNDRNQSSARGGLFYWKNYYSAKGRSNTGIVDKGIDTDMLFNDQWTTVTF